MRYEQDIQVKLRERYRRLFKTGLATYDTECGYLRAFIHRVPALKTITDMIERSLPDLDADSWLKDNIHRRGYSWPDTEEGRAKVIWQLLNNLADGTTAPLQISGGFSPSSGGNTSSQLRDMTEQAIEPFVEYLEERLGTESQTLYLLERLKRRIEAFDAEELHATYEKDSARGEAIYDRYIQKFLFDQGIDYIISQPRSSSGEADIIANLESDDAIVEETKLYNGDSYGKSYLRKGFNQAIQYAHDFNKVSAHLVIVNLSPNNLQLPSDEDPSIWPPRLHSSGVTVYMVSVRALPADSASRRGSQKTVQISREDLVIDGE